jgi:hypothetical protein
MHPTAPTRCAAVLLLLAGSPLYAQSPALPATPPTQLPIAAPVPAASPAGPARHPAGVNYSDGLLQVTADNSSLNQVLRAIAAATGMSITGGVADQRVFGKYGPATPAQVLASLLDGAGVNMIVRVTPSEIPVELVLTQQLGGPSPPSPSVTAYEDAAPPAQPVRPPFQPQPTQLQPNPQSVPIKDIRAPRAPQSDPPSGFVSAPTVDPQTAPGTTPGPQTQTNSGGNPQSPNGAKTPQQIYQELQQPAH